MGIVVVFSIGVVKNLLTNRHMRKQEVIDTEKQARLSEMRKSGLRNSRRIGDIPFGVRAIQAGVEVEGVWISRAKAKPSDTEEIHDSTAEDAVVEIHNAPEEEGTKEKKWKGKERATEPEPETVAENIPKDLDAMSATDDFDGTEWLQKKDSYALLPTSEYPSARKLSRKGKFAVDEMGDEQARKIRARDLMLPFTSQEAQARLLNRTLEKMTSMDMREEQDKKWNIGLGGHDSIQYALVESQPETQSKRWKNVQRQDDDSSSMRYISDELPTPTSFISSGNAYSDEVLDPPTPTSAPFITRAQSQGRRRGWTEETLRQLDDPSSNSDARVETPTPGPSQAPRREDSPPSSSSSAESFVTSEEISSLDPSQPAERITMSARPKPKRYYPPRSGHPPQTHGERTSSSERGPFVGAFDTPNMTPLLAPLADPALAGSHILADVHTQPQPGPVGTERAPRSRDKSTDRNRLRKSRPASVASSTRLTSQDHRAVPGSFESERTTTQEERAGREEKRGGRKLRKRSRSSSRPSSKFRWSRS